MPGTVIGISMNYGYPGTEAQNSPSAAVVAGVVATYANNVSGAAAANINFGDPVVLLTGSTGLPVFQQVADWMANGGGTQSALPAQFAGIARRAVKSAEIYMPAPTLGYYAAGSPIEVIRAGIVSVTVGGGTNTIGAAVYIRTATNAGLTTDSIGTIEGYMSDHASNQALLNNTVFRSGLADGNNVTMIHIQLSQAT
jgi:hypothetical protein